MADDTARKIETVEPEGMDALERRAHMARRLGQPAPITDLSPELLPARVVYAIGRGLIADPALAPDTPPPVFLSVPEDTAHARLANGLTVRADAMARMVAKGATVNDAFRMCYRVRPGCQSKDIASRAARVTRNAQWRAVQSKYREDWERERNAKTFAVEDFVGGRLVHEAQTAESDSARVRSLELLGKTRGMFTDVKRIETIDTSKISELKQQLASKFAEIAQRYGLASPSQGDDRAGDPHHPTTPLLGAGPPGQENHMNPLTPPPFSQENGNGSPMSGSHAPRVGVFARVEGSREMEEGDL